MDLRLSLGGADVEARLAVALDELGLQAGVLDRPLRSLSGGQASRAGLAALAVARCDVVLLDEPTNHLDADGLDRLAKLLAARAGGIVLVSHDRAFLAETAHEIVALDRRTGEASHWRGGWEAYERERNGERERARAEHDRALERRAKLAAAEQETRRRAAASLRRTRTHAHDNDKHLREWVTMRAEGMTARARKMGGRAERIEVPDAPWADPALRLALTPAERRRTWVVSLAGAVMRRGDWSLGPLDLAVAHGQRLRLSGPNGSGKSTVLAALAGDLALGDGHRYVAPGAVVAQLGQARDALTGPAPIALQVRELTGLDEAHARTALASFGITAELACRSGATLSPRERTRAERSSAPPVCCSTSRRTISTSSHSRSYRPPWKAGRGRSSLPHMIAASPRACGWTARWRCDVRDGCVDVTMGVVTSSEQERGLRELVALGCRILGANGHEDYVWGHVSARDPEGRGVWMKASTFGFDEITAEHVVLVSFDGDVLVGEHPRHLEWPIHTEVMRARPDVSSVVHSHPPHSIALGASGQPLLALSHAATMFVPPDVPRYTRTAELIVSAEMGQEVAASIAQQPACLLVNHGIVTAGEDVREAVIRAVLLERAAHQQMLTQAFGTVERSSPDDEALRKRATVWSDAQVGAMWAYLERRLAAGSRG